MTIEEFRATLAASQPPAALSLLLQALWWDARGEFDRAHTIAQEESSGPESAWVHAYLHRKEGDSTNAGYWYRRARRPHPGNSSAEEWMQIASVLLHQSGD